MKRFLLLFLLAFQATYAVAASPIIYYGRNSKDLTANGLITQILSLPNSGFYAKLQAPTLSASETFTLPTTTGATGQVLQTDGTGVLSWQSPASNVFNTQALTAVTAVGTAGFPQLGHILDSKDFTAETSAQFTFYNLSANPNDGGPQAKNLVTVGSPTFASTGILGGATAAALSGTGQYFKNTTDAYFNPGNVNFAAGGWFNLTSWGTNGQYLVAQAGSGTDISFAVKTASNGLEMQCSNATTTWDTDVVTPVSLSGWHHVVFVFDKTNGYCRLYVDGKQASAAAQASVRAATTSIFNVGGILNGTGLLTGSVEDVFVVNGYLMTADDIRKLAARRFDHNSGISPDAQVWSGTWGRSDQVPYTNLEGWIVSKEKNSLWADFSGVATGAFVGFKGQSLSYSSTSVSQFSYDSTWLSTTPATTIAHGMGAIPDNCKVQYTTAYGASGAAQTYDCGNYCSADSTNFYCDWTGLTVNSTNTVRLTAWMNGVQTAVGAASAGASGIVNTSAQTFAGAKTFNSQISAVGGLDRPGDDAVSVWNTTANDLLISATLNPVTFDTVLKDVTSAWASNTYTCKIAGNYRVSVGGSSRVTVAGNASDEFDLAILKNGSNLATNALVALNAGTTTGNWAGFAANAIVTLAVGDTVKLSLTKNTGGSPTISVRGINMTISRL